MSALPEWLSAIGSLLMFLWVVVLFSRSLRIERVDHARLVSAWPEPSEKGFLAEGDGETHFLVKLVLSNRSEEPVYGCRVFIRHYAVLGSMSEATTGAEDPLVLPPGTRQVVVHAGCSEDYEHGWDGLEFNADEIGVELVFRDSRGSRWRRSSDGRLHGVGRGTRRQRSDRRQKPAS
jgi:hypothetical protein